MNFVIVYRSRNTPESRLCKFLSKKMAFPKG